MFMSLGMCSIHDNSRVESDKVAESHNIATPHRNTHNSCPFVSEQKDTVKKRTSLSHDYRCTQSSRP